MSKESSGGRKIIAKNKKAFHNYHVHDRFEAGIVLIGTEVKSLRDGKLQLVDAYARFKQNELWLINAHISEYKHGNLFNHVPTRDRKLLMHKREMKKLQAKMEQKGFTLVPLQLYFIRGMVKVELGLATGKKLYDKRQDLKSKEAKREIQRNMREKF